MGVHFGRQNLQSVRKAIASAAFVFVEFVFYSYFYSLAIINHSSSYRLGCSLVGL
jgi:hypothetical protein